MNEEDIHTLQAERDASPERFPGRTSIDVAEYGGEKSPSSMGGRGINGKSIASYAVDSDLHRHPTALDRIATHRHQHFWTVGESALKKQPLGPLPEFGAGKPWPQALPDQEEYVVEFNGPHDPLHAQNWSARKKFLMGSLFAFSSLSTTLGSSILSPATPGFTAEYHVGEEVGTLATALFVLGYAFGPIVWAPGSELLGRRLPLLAGSFGFSVLSIAVASAENLQTILISRFFAGLFGSCPLAVVPASMADMYDNKYRGLAIAVFSTTVSSGPLLGPFIGGFTYMGLGWRWTEYISAIIGFTSFTLCLLFLKETYPPIILVEKAAELRRRTKNWGIHAKQEEVEVDIHELLSNNLSRPLRLLFTEPIVLATSIYAAFVYGLLYLFLTAYSIIFEDIYRMNPGVAGLPYFGMIVGQFISFGVIWAMNPAYTRKLMANNDIPVPEWRLPVAVAGGVSFSVGLFFFGWTGHTNKLPWIVPTLSGLFTGFGFLSIFLQLMNYTVDAYLMFAASAMAANTFMRSMFGAIFPMFATYMFDGLGVAWALTLLGCVAALLVPLPVIFYIYGKKIRAKSRFAPAKDILQDEQRSDEEGIPNLGQ